jgi:hypothetical protein
MVSSGSSEFEYKTKENLKWRKLKMEINDPG